MKSKPVLSAATKLRSLLTGKRTLTVESIDTREIDTHMDSLKGTAGAEPVTPQKGGTQKELTRTVSSHVLTTPNKEVIELEFSPIKPKTPGKNATVLMRGTSSPALLQDSPSFRARLGINSPPANVPDAPRSVEVTPPFLQQQDSQKQEVKESPRGKRLPPKGLFGESEKASPALTQSAEKPVEQPVVHALPDVNVSGHDHLKVVDLETTDSRQSSGSSSEEKGDVDSRSVSPVVIQKERNSTEKPEEQAVVREPNSAVKRVFKNFNADQAALASQLAASAKARQADEEAARQAEEALEKPGSFLKRIISPRGDQGKGGRGGK